MKRPEKDLFDFLEGWENTDLPFFAWWAFLEEGVEAFNRTNGTDFDPNDMVHEYLRAEEVR